MNPLNASAWRPRTDMYSVVAVTVELKQPEKSRKQAWNERKHERIYYTNRTQEVADATPRVQCHSRLLHLQRLLDVSDGALHLRRHLRFEHKGLQETHQHVMSIAVFPNLPIQSTSDQGAKRMPRGPASGRHGGS